MSHLATRLLMTTITTPPYSSVVLADGPWAYWPLDETSGTTALDLTGNARNGVYQAGAQLGSASLLPVSNDRYVVLTGASDSYVDVSAASQFCAGAAWTIECWAKVASYNNVPTSGSVLRGVSFLGNDTSGAGTGLCWGCNSPGSSLYGGCFLYWPHWDNEVVSPTDSAPAIGSLAHVVLTMDAGLLTMYLNSTAIRINSGTVGAGALTPLTIGQALWTSGAMHGAIGEVALYACALGSQQVLTHWLAGTQPPSERLADWSPDAVAVAKREAAHPEHELLRRRYQRRAHPGACCAVSS